MTEFVEVMGNETTGHLWNFLDSLESFTEINKLCESLLQFQLTMGS